MSNTLMRVTCRAMAGISFLAMATGAFAQGASTAAAPGVASAAVAAPADPGLPADRAATAAADPLFTALGGRAGVVAISNELVDRASSDPKIGSFFAHTVLADLKQQVADHLCMVAGGPCVYGGASMKKAHVDLNIQRADFNRLVELLQLAMDAQHVPFADQNRLLARLAPMHRDVIERDAPATARPSETTTATR